MVFMIFGLVHIHAFNQTKRCHTANQFQLSTLNVIVIVFNLTC